MECQICHREHSEDLPFFCTGCARSISYLPRLEHAQILLEKSELTKQVEEVVSTGAANTASPSKPPASGEGRSVWQAEIKQVEANEIRQKIERTKQDASLVRQESQELRDQIKELQTKITAKKKIFQTLRGTLSEERKTTVLELSEALSKASSISTRLSDKFTSNRATICREAAALMRFRQRRRQKDAVGREQYSIAGLTLPDLRHISNIRCTDLAAVLGSVARLLMLIAFYLGIRLPAEIVLAHTDYPYTTINLPKGSYLGRNPESSSAGGAYDQGSPSASKHELGTLVVPRPLFLGTANKADERVFQFQQKQEQTFNFFIEGIALLAWNVAWLCRSQGFLAGTNNWEDICDIGKNLHLLIFAQSPIPALTRISSDKAVRRTSYQGTQSSLPGQIIRKNASGLLGKHSDLSSGNQGSGQDRWEIMLTWKYAGWQAVAAPLRKILYEENVSAEWELLKDQEWDDGGEQFDEAVFIKSRALDGQQYDDARSIMTTRTRVEDDSNAANRVPGTSGWTKLKSRDKS